MSESRRNRRIGIILAVSGVVLWLAMGLLIHLTLRPEAIAKEVQKSVLRMDEEMQTLIDQGLNLSEIEKSGIGLFIFSNDSLTYWNNNELHPKIVKRRITVGHDTICSVPSGDYYFKSIEKDHSVYYLFKLLNMHYRIENQYFENGFKPISKFIDAPIQLLPNEGNFDILYYKHTG